MSLSLRQCSRVFFFSSAGIQCHISALQNEMGQDVVRPVDKKMDCLSTHYLEFLSLGLSSSVFKKARVNNISSVKSSHKLY